MDAMTERISRMEEAVTALAVAEFGDTPGHPFRGNQYKDGESGHTFPNEHPAQPDHWKRVQEERRKREVKQRSLITRTEEKPAPAPKRETPEYLKRGD